ncbi:MAG: glycosyl transferase 4 family protein [Cupriavidus sp.]|nr:MAG: glycosyl transferase 4 family protein [Cupriavidus sp.]
MAFASTTEAISFIATLLCSLGMSALLVLTQRWHGRLSLDHDTTGVQKLHKSPVPRVGGMGIALGLLLGALLLQYQSTVESGNTALLLLLCAVPVFAAGLLEDLTKRVSVRMRLLASVVSALFAIWLMDAQLTRLDTPVLDLLMTAGPFAALFTCFAISGVTHSINIIDGLNGLASGSVAIMLSGLGAIAWMQGDAVVLQLCTMGVAALLGFMVLNYPFGKLFLGDGGAYLAGFWLASCAVLLLMRNPQVSTWSVLLVCFYPVWETAFSMYRRHVVHKVSSGDADMQHLHHLVLRQVIVIRLKEQAPAWVNHGLATPVCWLMILGCQGMALPNYQDTSLSMLSTIVFVAIYQWLYRSSQERMVTASLR